MEIFTYQGFALRLFHDHIDATNPRDWDNVTAIEGHARTWSTFAHEAICPPRPLAVRHFSRSGNEYGSAENADITFFVTRERFFELCGSLKQWNAGRRQLGLPVQTLREAAFTCIEQEADTFFKYINGEVYGWEIVSPDGQALDSCGSVWYGYPSLKEAQESGEFTAASFEKWVKDYQTEHSAEVLQMLLNKCEEDETETEGYEIPLLTAAGSGVITGIKGDAIICQMPTLPGIQTLFLHPLAIDDAAARLALIHAISNDIF